MKNLLIDTAEDADVFDLDLSAIFERGEGHGVGGHEARVPGTTRCTASGSGCTCPGTTCVWTCGGTTGKPCAC